MEQQSKEDQLWRLAIHRMDLRKHTTAEPQPPEGETPEEDTDAGEPPAPTLRFDPKPPDPDLQALVDENASRQSAMNSRLGLLNWGIQTFKRETGRHDPAHWAAKLAEAQAMPAEDEDGIGTGSAPGIVAAVCARDRWDEMTQPQREWCVDTICSEVLRHADDNDPMERMQRNPMAADRACASVLAALLRKPMDQARADRVKTAFAAAFTHPVDEVRSYAVGGIDESVWAADRPLALRCLNAIAAEAVASGVVGYHLHRNHR
jgi:hypothetical protein